MQTPEAVASFWIALVRAQLERDEGLCAALGAQIESARSDEIPAFWLRSRLGLSERQERVVWTLFACEVADAVRAKLCPLGLQPSVAALQRFVYGEAPSLEAWHDLSDSGVLATLQLVQRTDGGDARTPESVRTLRLHPRVRALLLGDRGLADDVAAFAVVDDGVARVEDIVAAPGALEALQAAAAAERACVVVTGMRGAGKTFACRAVAPGAIIVDASRLADDGGVGEQLRAIARESRLLAADVIVRDVDGRRDLMALVDRELLPPLRARLFVTAVQRPAFVRMRRAVSVVGFGAVSAAQCRMLWQRAVPSASERDVRVLAATYPLAPALIDAVGRAVSATPTESEIVGAIEAVVGAQVGELADRVVTTQTWDDVVLPDAELETIEAIVARVRQRDEVFEQWGFARKAGRGLGTVALLSGPPGTGKTMTAALIAKELGLAMYQVDLSRMVSKWVGETEKNLAALFDAAEASNCVLLFDEADALFGKRTDVTSSNDRHANMEVNFLLQRIERFTGVCFLTTNHETAIDDAFRRRLSFHVRFALPEAQERAALWKAMLPAEAPVDGGVDFEALGKRLAMSGGYIKNAVLRAAFAACNEGRAITMEHLCRAGAAEYEAMGRVAYVS